MENKMDPGDIPAFLPKLTQIEEMIIARSHVQMTVFRYRGHQYHYSGHCVSFMQTLVKMVDVLPNLPSELDIVVLRPSDPIFEGDSRYKRQFKGSFRVRKNHVKTWLVYLRRNHSDYRYISICDERLAALPEDGDVSSSFQTITEDMDELQADGHGEEAPRTEESSPNGPAGSGINADTHSMIPNLNITDTELELLLSQLQSSATLRLAYAITVHKSQGLTLKQVVLNVNKKEHCLGLAYVAISRVKALSGILFESVFDFDRFKRVDSTNSRDRDLDYSYRTRELL
jgi:hypothetical protein